MYDVFNCAQKVESGSPSELEDSPVRPVLEDGAVPGAQVEENAIINVVAQSSAIVPPLTSSTVQNSSQTTAIESSDAVLTCNKEARLIGQLPFKNSFCLELFVSFCLIFIEKAGNSVCPEVNYHLSAPL